MEEQEPARHVKGLSRHEKRDMRNNPFYIPPIAPLTSQVEYYRYHRRHYRPIAAVGAKSRFEDYSKPTFPNVHIPPLTNLGKRSEKYYRSIFINY